MVRAFSLCYGVKRSRGVSDPEHESESPGTVILPPIQTHGISARRSDGAGCTGESNYTAALGDSKRDRGISTVFTQHIQSCQVFGACLYLPFLHFLQLSTAAASEPLTQTGSSSGGGGMLVPCFQTTSKQKETKCKHTLSSSCSSSSPRHALAPPLSL